MYYDHRWSCLSVFITLLFVRMKKKILVTFYASSCFSFQFLPHTPSYPYPYAYPCPSKLTRGYPLILSAVTDHSFRRTPFPSPSESSLAHHSWKTLLPIILRIAPTHHPQRILLSRTLRIPIYPSPLRRRAYPSVFKELCVCSF